MRLPYWLMSAGCLVLLVQATADSSRSSKSNFAPATVSEDGGARLFDVEIAPLLARHCVECHGPETKKSRLDLSRKGAALAGGRSGPVIVPGNAAESLLWEYVESDEMPADRPPLSAREKQVLREWIDAGAIWSAEEAAPLAYLEDRKGKSGLRRLTVPEYIQTVKSAVGINIANEARRILPQDLRADGFHNTAYNLNVDLKHVEAYAELAQLIVERMEVKAFASEYAKCQELTEPCLRELIAEMGKWLLRGPLEEHEVDAFLSVATSISEEGGDYSEAVGYVLEAMLQSPRFIYRIEKEQQDGTPRSNNYELASRLSYSLWGAPPDRELMRAADAGELSDRSAVEGQVRRMLEDPKAVERSLQFLYEWLNLGRLSNLRPDPHRFPSWDDSLAEDMRSETLAFFREIAWDQERPLSDLMNAQVTYATPRLANYYDLAPEHAADGEQHGVPQAAFGPERIQEGLQVLYRFDEESGATIRDTADAGEPLNLAIADTSAVQWSENGLQIKGSTLITSAGSATKLIEAVKGSNALTLDVWITPSNTTQNGPARIVTLSSGTGQRNFTLGQDGDRFEVRLRTTRRDANGLPGVTSPRGTVEIRPVHVVYTRDVTGRGKLYINGEQKGAHNADGDLSNWDGGFQLALANETSRDRPWRGTLHRVGIYSRALTPEEIRSKGQSMSRYDLASVPARGGLLTQGSLLTVGGEEASMVARGLFILNNFLFGKVDDPPPCVDTTPVPAEPGKSQRAISEARLANLSCGSCHSSFEPFAFGLERFDGLGAYREKDEFGNALREDGKLLFPGHGIDVPYRSSGQLMDLLSGSGRVRMAITRKLTQFALGRPLTETDKPALDQIHRSAQSNGGTYASLITAIVMSDLVQKNPTETNE